MGLTLESLYAHGGCNSSERNEDQFTGDGVLFNFHFLHKFAQHNSGHASLENAMILNRKIQNTSGKTLRNNNRG